MCCGADWSINDNKKSNALHYAALGSRGCQNVEVVKFLTEDQHADYKSLVDDRFSLLYLATKASNVDLVGYIADMFPELLSMKTCDVSPLEFERFKKEEEIATFIEQRLAENVRKVSDVKMQEPLRETQPIL